MFNKNAQFYINGWLIVFCNQLHCCGVFQFQGFCLQLVCGGKKCIIAKTKRINKKFWFLWRSAVQLPAFQFEWGTSFNYLTTPSSSTHSQTSSVFFRPTFHSVTCMKSEFIWRLLMLLYWELCVQMFLKTCILGGIYIKQHVCPPDLPVISHIWAINHRTPHTL